MDFQVFQTTKCLNGEFQFVALSDAAKHFTATRMGAGAVGFTLDQHHFGSAVRAILGENLTIQMQ